MASFAYRSFLPDLMAGDIVPEDDTFYAMLLQEAYAPSATTHAKRSDLTNEASGTGYTAGGAECVVTVTRDDANNRLIISLASVEWPASTIEARYAGYYKRRGGLASADELVGLLDFGETISTVVSTFLLPDGLITFRYD